MVMNSTVQPKQNKEEHCAMLLNVTMILKDSIKEKTLASMLRMNDLSTMANGTNWLGLDGPDEKYWIDRTILDNQGEMSKVTREAILAMNFSLESYDIVDGLFQEKTKPDFDTVLNDTKRKIDASLERHGITGKYRLENLIKDAKDEWFLRSDANEKYWKDVGILNKQGKLDDFTRKAILAISLDQEKDKVESKSRAFKEWNVHSRKELIEVYENKYKLMPKEDYFINPPERQQISSGEKRLKEFEHTLSNGFNKSLNRFQRELASVCTQAVIKETMTISESENKVSDTLRVVVGQDEKTFEEVFLKTKEIIETSMTDKTPITVYRLEYLAKKAKGEWVFESDVNNTYWENMGLLNNQGQFNERAKEAILVICPPFLVMEETETERFIAERVREETNKKTGPESSDTPYILTEEDEKLFKAICITVDTAIKQAIEVPDLKTLFRMSDLLEKTKNIQWNNWSDDSKEYWQTVGILENNGELHGLTRKALLDLNPWL